MGYTHYWTDYSGDHDLPLEAVTHIKQVTDHAFGKGLIQREYDDPRHPLVTAREIRFNGVRERGHETFCYSTKQRGAFRYCKTLRKPYDAVVMRVLLILGYYREGLEIGSDGEFGGEWAGAIAWFNREIGWAYVKTHLDYFRRPKQPAIEIPGLSF